MIGRPVTASTRVGNYVTLIMKIVGNCLTADRFTAWLRSAGTAVLRPVIESAADGSIRLLGIEQEISRCRVPAAARHRRPRRYRMGIRVYTADGDGATPHAEDLVIELSGART